MIRLHYSNRLENLIGPLADAIAAEQRAHPLGRIAIAVPNRAVEQFARYRIAEKIGVAANLDFPFLRRHLADLALRADLGLRIVEAEHLQLILFECLRDADIAGAPELAPVRAYLAAGGGERDERRMFDFAGQVARLFHEYSIARRQMIRGWRHGPQFATGAAAEHERWQRTLWRAIFDDRGCVLDRWIAGPRARWMLLPDAFDALEAVKLGAALPPSLHFFGLSYAGPAYIRIFDQLAQRTAVAIYALNPCCEFWEDVKTVTGGERAELIHRGAKLPAGLDASDDPFALAAIGDTPVLRLWGRPGREYIRMLNEAAECDFDARFSDDLSGGARTLLEELQHDVLVRAPERPAVEPGRGMADDGSIRMLECPGIRREVEIVANEIWSLLGAGRGPDATGENAGPRFHEIAVLVPDAGADEYLAHVESVFDQQHGIPVDFVARRLAGESRVAEAVALLLALPLPRERFGRPAMLHLLTHPALLGGDPDFDTERWAGWTRALGVFFGADQDDVGNTYLAHEQPLAHWDQALRRLALGVFMERDHAGAIRRFDPGGGAAALLPHQLGEQDIASVARLVRESRRLIADALELRTHRMPLSEWSRALVAFIAAHLEPASADDQRILDRCVAALESMGAAEIKSEAVGYETAHALACERIADADSQSRRLFGRGVAVGRLADLRALPFRVIFALGLGEANFPEREHRDPIDLRVAARRAGDVTATERDRYFFLETLVAARERIYLSWIGRDARTGDALEPSAVVRELQFVLRGYVDEQTLLAMTVRHPLSRYDLAYFPEFRADAAAQPGGLVSFDPSARSGARMSALREDLCSRLGAAAPPGRDDLLNSLSASAWEQLGPSLGLVETAAEARTSAAGAATLRLSVTALRRFLECPLQGAARYALGMTDDDDDEDAAGTDEEPLSESILDRSNLLRGVFWSARGDVNEMEREYKLRFAIAQAEGRAPAGPFADKERAADGEFLARWNAGARGLGDLKRWCDVRIGHADEFDSADQVLNPIVLEVELGDGAGGRVFRRVSLHGGAGHVARGKDGTYAASMLPVLRKDVRPKDFLRPVFSAILLSAAGEHVADAFDVVVVTGDGSQNVRRVAGWTREEARAYLSTLVSDLLSGENHYFLPIEAVGGVIADGRTAPSEIVQSTRERENRISSDYGPLRNVRERFGPPDDAQIRAIISRRFGRIAQIFEKEKRKRG